MIYKRNQKSFETLSINRVKNVLRIYLTVCQKFLKIYHQEFIEETLKEIFKLHKELLYAFL